MELIMKVIHKAQHEIAGLNGLIDQIYSDLTVKVRLLDNGLYFCDDEFIKSSVEETFKEIDDTQSLLEFYYNDSNGEEQFCYLLYFDAGGIYVINSNHCSLVNLVINEFNGINEKLDVLEVIVNKLKEIK